MYPNIMPKIKIIASPPFVIFIFPPPVSPLDSLALLALPHTAVSSGFATAAFCVLRQIKNDCLSHYCGYDLYAAFFCDTLELGVDFGIYVHGDSLLIVVVSHVDLLLLVTI